MTPQSFLDQARELDLDVRFIDALLSRAALDPGVHPKVVKRLMDVRAERVHAWGELWQTRPVVTK